MKRSIRIRRVPVVIAALTLAAGALGLLLWPLASREWAIHFDRERNRAKEEYLARERERSDAETKRPNIVLIVADDLGRQDVGIYGNPVVDTPNIDELGRDGVIFNQATATTAICAPSRAAMLTGRYQQRFGFEYQPNNRYPRNRLEYLVFRHLIDTDPMVPAPPGPVPRTRDIENQGLPPSELTIAELLQARGYRTAAYGKWHLGYNQEQFSPLDFGFDEHYGFYEAFSLYAPTENESVVNVRIDDFSDRHMWRQGRSGPSAIVHNDREVSEEHYLTDVLADRAVQFIMENSSASSGAVNTSTPRNPFFLYLPFSAPHTPLQAPRRHWNRYEEVQNDAHRAYYAMITALDDAVGRVLTALSAGGVADNTVVVFTSDNGGVTYMDISDNGDLAGGKFSNFRGGLVVPMVMRFPGRVSPGTSYDQPVSLLDLFPTFEAATRPRPDAGEAQVSLSQTENPLPAPVDGVNLMASLNGEPPRSTERTLFWRSGYNVAVRRGDWKLQIDRRHNMTRLYNIARDPGETSNYAPERPELVRRLESLLRDWERGLMPKRWPRVMDIHMDVHGKRYWFGI